MTPAQHEVLASAAAAAEWPREEVTLRVLPRSAALDCPADFVATVKRWQNITGGLPRVRSEVRAAGATADEACASVAVILRGVRPVPSC